MDQGSCKKEKNYLNDLGPSSLDPCKQIRLGPRQRRRILGQTNKRSDNATINHRTDRKADLQAHYKAHNNQRNRQLVIGVKRRLCKVKVQVSTQSRKESREDGSHAPDVSDKVIVNDLFDSPVLDDGPCVAGGLHVGLSVDGDLGECVLVDEFGDSLETGEDTVDTAGDECHDPVSVSTGHVRNKPQRLDDRNDQGSKADRSKGSRACALHGLNGGRLGHTLWGSSHEVISRVDSTDGRMDNVRQHLGSPVERKDGKDDEDIEQSRAVVSRGGSRVEVVVVDTGKDEEEVDAVGDLGDETQERDCVSCGVVARDRGHCPQHYTREKIIT